MTLSDRVAALTGPNREVDALIAIALGLVPDGAFRPCAAEDIGTFATGSYGFWSCAPYTASMDAAMSLVPEGWRGRIFVGNKTMGVEGFGGPHGAFFTPPNRWEPENALSELCWSPALAVCAAALRARGL